MQCPPGEIFFQFLENILTNEQRSTFLNHLSQCPICSQKIIFLNQVQRHFNKNNRGTKGRNCCSPATLSAFVDGQLDSHDNQKIIEHLLECEECLHTLLTLKDTLQANEFSPLNVPPVISKKVEQLGQQRRNKSMNLPVLANSRQIANNFITSILPLSRGTYLIPVGIAIVILLFAAYFPFSSPLEERVIIQAISPVAEIQTDCPVFKWKGYKGIRLYHIGVKCEDGQKIIWQAVTSKTSIQFPAEAVEKLISNHSYLWYIKGERKLGEIISSDSARFYISAASYSQSDPK